MLPQMGKLTAEAIVKGEKEEAKRRQLRTEAERQVAAHVLHAQEVAARVLGRWMQARWDEDATASAEVRRKRRRSEVLVEEGEEEEPMARHLELGRGERQQRRESEMQERKEHSATRHLCVTRV